MDWKVKYIDYPTQFRNMETEIVDTIKTVLSNGDLMLRQQLEDFEAHFAAFVGTKYAVGVSNCTDALHLSLRAANVGPGDEVITVSHTFVATAEAIHHAGGTPVFVDIGDDHNINVDLVEEAITPRTRAIIPVSLNGRICHMEKVMAVAERHGLIVIEDSAQALGASLNGKKAGSFGLAGCFSFYPAKLLGAFGDGGAMVTNSKKIAEKVRIMRNHGRTEDGDVACWSFNCRLDNLQAALLDLKLKQLPAWIARRRAIAMSYQRRLAGIKEIWLPPPPTKSDSYFDVFQNYEIEVENRDLLVLHLKQSGIEVMLPWGGKGIHQFKALNLHKYNLPRTEEMFGRVLMLPMNPELTDEQVEYVADAILKFYKKK